MTKLHRGSQLDMVSWMVHQTFIETLQPQNSKEKHGQTSMFQVGYYKLLLKNYQGSITKYVGNQNNYSVCQMLSNNHITVLRNSTSTVTQKHKIW
jgi:ABC-type transporter MlaC component